MTVRPTPSSCATTSSSTTASPLTAADVAASWRKIVDPPAGLTSARQSHFMMIDKIEAPDPATVVFRLKFATARF